MRFRPFESSLGQHDEKACVQVGHVTSALSNKRRDVFFFCTEPTYTHLPSGPERQGISERRVKSHFFPLKHSVLERKRSVASASAVPGASTDLFDAGRAVRRKQFESNEQAVRYCSEICDSLKYWIPPRVMNNADAARRGLKAISYERKMIRGKSYPPSSPNMSSQTHTIGREWQKREYAPPTQSARPV